MRDYVRETKVEILAKDSRKKLRADLEKDALIELRRYAAGAGNGTQAKLMSVVLTTLSRQDQARNNKRALDLAVQRMASLEVVGAKRITNGV